MRRTQQTVRNAEGEYAIDETTGPVFRCLYDDSSQSESRDTGGIRHVQPATLMVSKYATDGTLLDLRAQDRVQITTPSAIVGIFEVLGAPAPILKRRTVIGYTCNLSQVERSAA